MAYDSQPPPLTITRLDTGRTFTAQYRPVTANEKGGAEWDAIAIRGFSSSRQQFKVTKDNPFSFELRFIAERRSDVPRLVETKLWIKSIAKPRSAGVSLQSYGAPQLLLVVPGMYEGKVRIDTWDFTYERQNVFGEVIDMRCALVFMPIKEELETADDDTFVLVES